MNFALSKSRLAIAAAVTMTVPAFGQGTLDGAFAPQASASQQTLQINSIVPQSDGSLLFAGQFDNVAGAIGSLVAQRNVARFANGGTLDAAYRPEPGPTTDNLASAVFGIVAQPDGSALYSGAFTIANKGQSTQVTRTKIAKFGSDGKVDTLFNYTNPGGLASVTSLSPHTLDEGFVAAADLGMFRIKSDGSIDSAFQTYSSYLVSGAAVQSTTIQTDDKIILNGSYTVQGSYVNASSGVNNPYFDRVSSTGSAGSPAFTANPGITAATYCSVVQPDGKILVGGTFGTGNGYDTVGIARYKSDGTRDTDFIAVHQTVLGKPFLDGAVRAIALQADGKILIGGDFINVRTPVKDSNGRWIYEDRRGIVRLQADGTLDSTFDANITGSNFSVTGITQQADGRVIIIGNFQKIAGTDRTLAARLTNDSATQTLTCTGNSITWMRGGSSPEAKSVVLHWRPANSPDWQLVDGAPIRIAGGWTRTGIIIPPYSYVRASARTSGGIFNGSTGIVSSTIGYLIPKLTVSRAPAEFITNGGSTNLGTVGISYPKDFTITLNNAGTANLTGVYASFTGTDAAMFSVQTDPATSVAAGSNTPLVIRFNPTSTGTKTATLNIFSNDPASPTFSFTVSGTAISAIEAFRNIYFGTTANTGDAADSADSDGDGQNNLFEFVAGTVPNSKASAFTQRLDVSSGFAKLIFSPIVSGRSYQVESSTSLTTGAWANAVGTSSDNLTERTFTSTAPLEPMRFYRVKITKP